MWEMKAMLNYYLDIDEHSKWIITTKTEAADEMPFYLTELGDFYAGSRYYTERDNKDGYQLLYTASGAGRLHIGTQSLSLEKHTAVIVRCDVYHRYTTADAPWHMRWIHFGGTGADTYLRHINNGRYAVITLTDPAATEKDLDELAALAPRYDIVSYAQISNTISQLMTRLFDDCLGTAATATAAYTADITAVIDYIRKNYATPLTLDDLVRQVNISKFHFIRLFKKQTGITPYDYLVNQRIHAAKLLLRTTDMPIQEIADKVGYPSKSNFSQQFKALVGSTPGQYRQESLHMKADRGHRIK